MDKFAMEKFAADLIGQGFMDGYETCVLCEKAASGDRQAQFMIQNMVKAAEEAMAADPNAAMAAPMDPAAMGAPVDPAAMGAPVPAPAPQTQCPSCGSMMTPTPDGKCSVCGFDFNTLTQGANEAALVGAANEIKQAAMRDPVVMQNLARQYGHLISVR